MLCNYALDPSHVLEVQPMHKKESLSCGEESLQILGIKELKNKVIPLAKVL